MKFDNRTTSSVEESRSLINRKPFRNSAEKELARQTAVLCADGTYRSSAPVRYHVKERRE